MMPSVNNASAFKNSAVGSHTSTAAETTLTSVVVSFPGNSSAVPRKIRVSGSVSGYVQVQVSANKYINIACNPNSPYTEEAFDSSAFSGPVTALTIGFQCDAVGTIRAIVYGN